MAQIKNAQAFTSQLDMSTNKIINVVDPTNPQEAATKAYVDATAGDPADWSQYPATQDVDMDGNLINNVTDPVSAQDAATKAYVDANSGDPATWSTFPATQAVDMDSFAIENLAAPTNSTDAATKGYVDSNFVALTGNQTVGGTKSFTLVPNSAQDPSSGNDLVRKSYADSTYAELTQATVTTSSTSPTTIATIAVTSAHVTTIQAFVVGRNTATNDNWTGGMLTAVVSNASGTAAVVNTSFPVVMPTTTGTFDIAVSSGNALIQVTAPSSANYNWKVRYLTVDVT